MQYIWLEMDLPKKKLKNSLQSVEIGLMTDVLDEFDHVLGRDRNAGLDEKNGTQANQICEIEI